VEAKTEAHYIGKLVGLVLCLTRSHHANDDNDDDSDPIGDFKINPNDKTLQSMLMHVMRPHEGRRRDRNGNPTAKFLRLNAIHVTQRGRVFGTLQHISDTVAGLIYCFRLAVFRQLGNSEAGERDDILRMVKIK
jgi:hypothetical protein